MEAQASADAKEKEGCDSVEALSNAEDFTSVSAASHGAIWQFCLIVSQFS